LKSLKKWTNVDKLDFDECLANASEKEAPEKMLHGCSKKAIDDQILISPFDHVSCDIKNGVKVPWKVGRPML
jgi:hypothetical protein